MDTGELVRVGWRGLITHPLVEHNPCWNTVGLCSRNCLVVLSLGTLLVTRTYHMIRVWWLHRLNCHDLISSDFCAFQILSLEAAYNVALCIEWAIKIQIILIVGVATTVDVLRNTLSSNACSRISSCEFTLGTPDERMDAIIEAVLLKHSGSFSVGKQVMCFLRSYFLHHDGTLTLFVRALKVNTKEL